MDYGFLSLLPPIVAVVMAIKSKNVILSLFCGGFVGALIFAGEILFWQQSLSLEITFLFSLQIPIMRG